MRSITCDICNQDMSHPYLIVIITKHIAGGKSSMDVCSPSCLEDLGRYMGMTEEPTESESEGLPAEPVTGDVQVRDAPPAPGDNLRYLSPEEIAEMTGVKRRI